MFWAGKINVESSVLERIIWWKEKKWLERIEIRGKETSSEFCGLYSLLSFCQNHILNFTGILKTSSKVIKLLCSCQLWILEMNCTLVAYVEARVGNIAKGML